MKLSVSLLRPVALTAGLVLVAGLWAASAQAQWTKHALTGNARFQIGNGLPIPIAFSAPPNGKVVAVPGATAEQTTGVDPKAMRVQNNAWHYGITGFKNRKIIPVFGANNNLFQVMTNLQLDGPDNNLGPGIVGGSSGTISKNGRTGLATVSFCPGNVVTAGNNPLCANPGAGVINGRMVYTKTANQFGGNSQGHVGGSADVALLVNPGVPTSEPGTVGDTKSNCLKGKPGCLVKFAFANPATVGAQGGPFGYKNATAGVVPGTASGRWRGHAGTKGTLLFFLGLGETNLHQAGTANPVTEYGGPYTTGRITVSVTQAAKPTLERFTITGKDNRMNGVGTISLVSASVSNRSLSRPNANRGWLNLTLSNPIPGAPAIPAGGLAAIAGLLALAGGYVVRHRQAKA